MHFKHVIIVAPWTSLNAYQFCVLHFWTPNWDFRQFPWLNVPLVLIIISEWNSSVKDKWNTKSIYVVGKATAALGELLSHYENIFHLCGLCFLLTLAMLMLILAECGRHLVLWWQKCVKWCYHLETFGNRLYTSDSLLWHRGYLVFRKRAGAAPSWRVFCLLSLATVHLFYCQSFYELCVGIIYFLSLSTWYQHSSTILFVYFPS